jgi:hypothetical protein
MVEELKELCIFKALKLMNVVEFWVTPSCTRAMHRLVFRDALNDGYRCRVAQ